MSRSFNRREVATIAATTRHGRQFANRSLHARMEENIRGWVSPLDWIGLDFILIMDRPLRVNHRVHYHRYYHRWSFRLNTYWIFVFVFHLYHCSSIAQLRHLSMPKFALKLIRTFSLSLPSPFQHQSEVTQAIFRL